MLEVRLLGAFEVKKDGKVVAIPSRPAQSLFAYLILSTGTSHRREKLAGLLWPDSLEETARDNLRHALWRMRKALEAASATRFLHADDLTISFKESSDYWLDAAELEKLSENSPADELTTVLSSYQGELLPGFYDEWAVLEREHLSSIFEHHMARLMSLLQDERRWLDILDWGERWIKLGQRPEPAYRALMSAHAAKGDMSKVAATYERCIRSLKEFGVQPSEQTRALYERLKGGKETLETESAISVQENRKESPKTNLPNPLTSFIGREKEIGEINQLLGRHRLVTLTGPGGVGKTRLAIQSSNQLMGKFKDGLWWVELAPLTDAAFVPQAVAQTLGVRESPNQPLIESLKSFLREKQLLLVLDNCEHLIIASAQFAFELLSHCASVKILTTSRETLGITGEMVYPVPTLSLPTLRNPTPTDPLDEYESIRLFVERASAVKADFVLTERNAVAVLQICQRLEGISLAIELAAARTKLLTVEQIAERLNDRFNLLTQGSRTALPRHQTLRAAMDWSYDLLSEPERLLFGRLSVFAGGFTLQAAEGVGSEGDVLRSQVIDLLGQLINKSLVIIEARSEDSKSETRYGMLETIREYAREKLDESSEAQRVRNRHLDFFMNLAEEAEPRLYGVEQVNWLARLEIEHDNLRTALDWSFTGGELVVGWRLAGALWWFWSVHGHPSEGQGWLEKVLATGYHATASVRAKTLLGAGYLAGLHIDYPRAIALNEASLTLYRELQDKHGIIMALTNLWKTALDQANFEQAKTYLEESLALSQELGDGWSIVASLGGLGHAAYHQRDYARAINLYNESMALARKMGNTRGIAICLTNLSEIALAENDYARATKLLKESLILGRELGDKELMAETWEGLARVAGAHGHPDRSARLFGAAEALFEAIGMPFPPAYRATYERRVAAVGEQLDKATFANAWEEGRALTLEQAVEFALKETGI